MNTNKWFSWVQPLFIGSRRRITLSIIGGIFLVYIVTGVVVGKTAYSTLTPSKTLRNAVQFFPLPAARVDSTVIWMSHYMDRYSYIDSFIRKTDTANFTPQKTRDQVVDYLVETALIAKLAGQQHVSVNKSDIQTAYDEIANKPGVGGTAEVEKVLKELWGMDPTQFKQLIGEQLLRERVEQQVFLHVTARQILVSTEAQANDLANQVKNGADFATLAQQYSQDVNSRDKGGDLGSVGRGSGLPKEVEDAIFALSPDALPSVVKSDLGYHVIDTEQRVGVIDQNFSDWLGQQKQDRSISVYLKTDLDWVKK